MMLDKVVHAVNETLNLFGMTMSQLLLSTLSSRQHDNHPITVDLLSRSAEIFLAITKHPASGSDMLAKQVHEISCDLYLRELREITSEDHGWHFGAFHTTTKQLEEFRLEDMAQDISMYAPKLWKLLDRLLGGNDGLDLGSMQESDRSENIVIENSNDGDYWDAVDEIDLEGFINGLTSEASHHNSRLRRRAAAVLIVCIDILITKEYTLRLLLLRKRLSSSGF